MSTSHVSYIPRVYFLERKVSFDSINFKNKTVYLGAITSGKLTANIIKDKNSSNYQFIIDSLLNKEKSNSKWKYKTNEVEIKNSHITVKDVSSKPSQDMFNIKDIEFANINLLIDDFNSVSDSVSFRIKTFECDEQSGLSIQNFKGGIGIGKTGIGIKNVRLKTNHSYLSIDYLELSYDSAYAFNDFANRVSINLKINSLSADYHDLKKIIPTFPQLKNKINIRGEFKGTISNLQGRNIQINAGDKTELQTNFDIKGLPDITESFVYLNVKKLKTDIYDLAKIATLNKETREFDFPESFKNLGTIEYSGIFSGFIDNLVAYGEFNTDLGILKTDIGFKMTENNRLVYSGFLNTKELNIGKLINSENNLNKVTMDVTVNGYRNSNKFFNAYISGTIDSIDFNNYKYEKLELNGLLSNNRFDGKIAINDPNAQVAFNGKMDFKNEIPEFDFTASLKNIKPDKLKLLPKLKNSNISIKLNSTLSGKTLNTVVGNINLYDGELLTENDHIFLDTLSITSFIGDSIKKLDIKSDIVDAEMIGEYQLSSLVRELKKQLSNYLPSVFYSDHHNTSQSNFRFNITTKNLESLIKTFNPKIAIADSTQIKGYFNSTNNTMSIEGNCADFRYNSISGKNLDFLINSNENKLNTNIKSENVRFGEIIPLYNFSLIQESEDDNMKMDVLWNNMGKVTNSGEIHTNTKFSRVFDNQIFTNISLLPSTLTIKDTIWNIQDSEINISPNGVGVNTFRVHHSNQEIGINGSVYNNSNSSLSTHFQNIDLSDLTELINIKKLSFEGLLNGNVNIKNNFENPIITSDLIIKNLNINKEKIGDLEVESIWDNEAKAVLLNTQATRGNIKPLVGSGYFIPKDKDYNFNCTLDSLPIGFLNLYLNKVLQNLNGTASGNIVLKNGTEGNELSGNINVNKAKFDVDLLQSSYTVEDSIIFTAHKIDFKNMILTDRYNRKGKFNGSISHTNFFGMKYNLYIRANNMLLLDTKEKDNPLYYGKVFGTGDLAILGETSELTINIDAKTEKDTKFYIPMSDREESLNNNFIQFINPDKDSKASSDSKSKQDEYKVDLSNYALNMGIEITPDAQIQVIFDPTLGDILKSSGRGNLQIQVSKEGEVSFFGEYKAEEGDYLFSLENVVNKRFDINKGGTVTWEGDPYDAIVDLTATYKLKTSIQPLVIPSTSSSTNRETYRRVPINCDMILSGRISQPNIRFAVSAPTMEQSTKNLIEDAISTDEELNRQVLSLLILNKFYTPDYYSSNSGENRVNTAALANTSEMISSQLSNWLSQISNDFDVGISYRPEDEISSEQLEVALSTQIFNDRVTLNGNVEYGAYDTKQRNTNNIVGDFDMDVKLNKSGNLRAKAYTHSNDDYIYDSSPTTQGVGISYQEEFNTFGELIRKYWNWITGKAKKEKEIVIENE